ncbi:glycosyltransferase family 59 protein [Lophiostoma macrostomum CBS 122681]|uniref:Dol-P-Glc:Glc(2)Man(9)GlcNAc(2)-PP-Dol alpha-1,2-glucosyltransferase n=1 Tax=Lophiostoma macrostomum CBS 122681 TaxID=1314788 RepID=A0A6A6T2J6_9PLEO|nr:glycosyltransferase family 59 protein [Lophiostoma macrostomum CBS 122681]
MSSLVQKWALPVSVVVMASAALAWYKQVSEHVPDPYLDEVFHVPQAQRYCVSDYTWDSKITTPPGLYLASLISRPLLGCDTSSLRLLNVVAICLICVLSFDILRTLRQQSSGRALDQGKQALIDAHSAFNIGLFPPLFFFSGIYYTDVMSTFAVLLSYRVFLRRSADTWNIRNEILSVLVGIFALSFRQTNIFWVAVFPAALATVHALKDLNPSSETSLVGPQAIIKESWSRGIVFDPLVHDATLQDYILLGLTTGLAALKQPLLVLRTIMPYLILLGLFGGFVAWNGGVVLGDKSNHVATIHTPQMLYVWPYVAFFSLPLVLRVFLCPVAGRLPNGRMKSILTRYLTGSSEIPRPNISSAIVFMIASLAAIHTNTIIHPFTLADNRHYVFYVFRIIRLYPTVKYLAVPIYYICAWSAIQTLGSQVKNEATRASVSGDNVVVASFPKRHASFIIVWLGATTLSTVSAPLVEPRYLIIPWIFWRLHVPTITASSSPSSTSPIESAYDMRLVLETVWHRAIHAITGYMFLHRGFAWANEPGNIQRFLW